MIGYGVYKSSTNENEIVFVKILGVCMYEKPRFVVSIIDSVKESFEKTKHCITVSIYETRFFQFYDEAHEHYNELIQDYLQKTNEGKQNEANN